MPSLYLTTPGTRAHLVSDRIRIEIPPSETSPDITTRDILISEIERVLVSPGTSLTTSALAALLERDIPTIITSHSHQIAGICVPPAPHSIVRLAQYRLANDPPTSLAVATNIVEAKILNSRRVLQRLSANREDPGSAATLAALKNAAAECAKAENLESLQGYEGSAAGRYFEAYGSFFPPEAPFEYRSRRPPHNAVNSVLSYTYSILISETECQLHIAGLDPTIGFLHTPTDRRPSLALDLIEPFRAPVADSMVLDLFSHGTLQPARHFEKQNGGIYLNPEGKKRFFVAYERRMEREFTSEHFHRRTSLRNEILNQILALKKTFLDGEPLLPFLMN